MLIDWETALKRIKVPSQLKQQFLPKFGITIGVSKMGNRRHFVMYNSLLSWNYRMFLQ